MSDFPNAIIRLARPDDAAAMLAIYAPLVRETVISFQMELPPEDAFREHGAAPKRGRLRYAADRNC